MVAAGGYFSPGRRLVTIGIFAPGRKYSCRRFPGGLRATRSIGCRLEVERAGKLFPEQVFAVIPDLQKN